MLNKVQPHSVVLSLFACVCPFDLAFAAHQAFLLKLSPAHFL